VPERTVAIRIDEELHKRIRMRIAESGMTLKDYIVGLVENDLSPEEPANKTGKVYKDPSDPDYVQMIREFIDSLPLSEGK